MQPDQGRGFSLLKVAVHDIPDLPVQLLQVVGSSDADPASV